MQSTNPKNTQSYLKPARIISFLLIIASFGWIGSIIANNWNAITEIISQLQPQNLVYLFIATLITALSIGLFLFLFKIILEANTKESFSLSFLGYLFFGSQIIRYLPGRFFSIAYQINKTHQRINPLKMIRVNIELLLLIICFHFIISASLITYYIYNPNVAFLIFTLGVLFVILYLRFNWMNSTLTLLKKIFPVKLQKLSFNPEHGSYSYLKITQLVLLLMAHWILYLIAWSLFGDIFVQLKSENTILLCATYTLSWIIGFVSIITPGGLGIREASFVLITSQIAPEHQTSFLAIFLRLWLIVVDCILFSVSYIIYKSKVKKNDRKI